MTSSENAARLLPLAEAHAAADEYQKGIYDGHRFSDAIKGTIFVACSIGCTIHDAKRLGMLSSLTPQNDHRSVANLIFGGIDRLSDLQEAIFEGLPDHKAGQWTPRLLRAISEVPKDAKWKCVWHRWAALLMEKLLLTKIDNARPLDKDARSAIGDICRLHIAKAKRHEINDTQWNEAANAAKICSHQSLRKGEIYLNSRVALKAASNSIVSHSIQCLRDARIIGVKITEMADMLIEAIGMACPITISSSTPVQSAQVQWMGLDPGFPSGFPAELKRANSNAQLLASTKAAQKALIAAMKESSSVPPGLYTEMMAATILLQDSLNLLKDKEKTS